MKGTLFSLLSGTYKRVGFFGLGRSSRAIMSLLPKGVETVLRSDKDIDGRDPDAAKAARIFTGASALSDIDEPLLILSPSVRRYRPELIAAKARGVMLSSDGEMFFESVDSPVFAVSGSDGKSTTATISAMLLGERFPDVSLCGNIGVPMCPELLSPHSAYVTELSSFQLTYAAVSARRAALTNLTPNHLNWHKDLCEYRMAKLSLIDSALEPVISVDSEESLRAAKERRLYGVTSGRLCYSELKENFSAEVIYTHEGGYIRRNGEALFPSRIIKRREEHNIKNLLTALALTDGYVSAEGAAEVAASFSGLPHRCSTVGSFDGVEYVNSSIDTTPSRTAETLRSLGRRVTVLLGGRGKGVGFYELRAPLREYAELAILFGECREELARDIGDSAPTVLCESFSEAVAYACENVRAGTVLLSPAATSYDEFLSFEERGKLFERLIFKYKSK